MAATSSIALGRARAVGGSNGDGPEDGGSDRLLDVEPESGRGVPVNASEVNVGGAGAKVDSKFWTLLEAWTVSSGRSRLRAPGLIDAKQYGTCVSSLQVGDHSSLSGLVVAGSMFPELHIVVHKFSIRQVWRYPSLCSRSIPAFGTGVQTKIVE